MRGTCVEGKSGEGATISTYLMSCGSVEDGGLNQDNDTLAKVIVSRPSKEKDNKDPYLMRCRRIEDRELQRSNDTPTKNRRERAIKR